MASEDELRMGSEAGGAVGGSELKSPDNDAVMTIPVCAMVEAVPWP